MHLGEMKFKKKSGKDDQAVKDDQAIEAGANVAKLLGKLLRHRIFKLCFQRNLTISR